MSSNPPADTATTAPAPANRRSPRGRRRRPLAAGWSLRAQLIAALVGLLAIVCLIIGASTVFALRPFLIDRVDQDLGGLTARATGQPPNGLGGDQNGPPPGGTHTTCDLSFMNGRGSSANSLGACIRDGVVTLTALNRVNSSGDVTSDAIPATQSSVLLHIPTNSRAYTRSLGSLGSYRVIATKMHDGTVTVTGQSLGGVQDIVWRLTAVMAVVSAAGLIVAAVAGAFIIRNTLRPLRRVASTAARVSDKPLDRGEVALSVRVPDVDTDPRTEVGQVGAAINRMLGHIGNALNARHASETRVRQFVADASHELRTPLAAIRGYAELTRRSGQPVSPDVAHALRRVESESARMTTLVEDLLLLARLDSGRPLEHEPVDLSRLVVDAVSDAHAAGPEHRWELDLPPEEVTVPGDGPRLHQVLANLLANARTHTSSGSTVVTSVSRAKPGWATLTVTDNGPGIPPNLLPDIFERFARGDSSRSRAAGSTGLGLAIVAAVVEAHRGRVEVTSRPGQTAFTVWLPNTGGT
jgi:two-component system OmpR family sensor kinase